MPDVHDEVNIENNLNIMSPVHRNRFLRYPVVGIVDNDAFSTLYIGIQKTFFRRPITLWCSKSICQKPNPERLIEGLCSIRMHIGLPRPGYHMR